MSEAVPPVATLVPHAAPMILIDQVLSHDADGLRASVRITPETRFFQPGRGVPAHVGIEWMAQACAAFAGLRGRQAGQPVRLGFLLGTRRYAATSPWFAAGACLTIAVSRTFEEDGMGVFDCRIEAEDGLRATARLTVYQPDDAGVVLAAP